MEKWGKTSKNKNEIKDDNSLKHSGQHVVSENTGFLHSVLLQIFWWQDLNPFSHLHVIQFSSQLSPSSFVPPFSVEHDTLQSHFSSCTMRFSCATSYIHFLIRIPIEREHLYIVRFGFGFHSPDYGKETKKIREKKVLFWIKNEDNTHILGICIFRDSENVWQSPSARGTTIKHRLDSFVDLKWKSEEERDRKQRGGWRMDLPFDLIDL